MSDAQWMARALRLAERGVLSTPPNPNVGCVLVQQNKLVGEGWHQKAGGSHAEVHALNAAGNQAKGATAYVTLEPCSHFGKTPPCARALIDSGVRKVVVAMLDPNPLVSGRGVAMLEAAGIEVQLGIGAEAAAQLNRGYIRRMRLQKPFVTLKLACSLDGKTAMASGESQWITATAARQDVHRMRARVAAILTASGTIMADNPRMTARVEGVTRQPVRVILDRTLCIDSAARVFQQEGETWLFCAPDVENVALTAKAQRVVRCGQNKGALDLQEVLSKLANFEINDVLIEAGSRLAGSFIKKGLLDELVVYMSPDVLGGEAMSLLTIPGLDCLKDRAQFEFKDVRHVGRDLKITLVPQK